jgi:integrase
MEIKADRKDLEPITCAEAANATVSDMIAKYQREVLPHKRSHTVQSYILSHFQRHPIAKRRVNDITTQDFIAFKEERLTQVSATTFNHQIAIISHAFETAIKEWSWPIRSNPLKNLRRPKNNPGRERRITTDEWHRLEKAAITSRRDYLLPVMRLAVETGMRCGEILGITWDNIDWNNRTLHLPLTKNGYARTIPLSSKALSVLQEIKQAIKPSKDNRAFMITGNAFKLAWQRLCKRAEVVDLHFHDLRHEAISRFIERGLSIPEVALISGHRDYRMLARYTHLRAEELVDKLK